MTTKPEDVKERSTHIAVEIAVPSIIVIAGSIFIRWGRFWLGIITVSIGVVVALGSMIGDEELSDGTGDRVGSLKSSEIIVLMKDSEGNHAATDPKSRNQCITCLCELAARIGGDGDQNGEDLPSLAQQASYITLRVFLEDDKVVNLALSLLALIGKNGIVRKRSASTSEGYGLDLPIRSMKLALQRARLEDDKDLEEQLAELLRKGSLFLGVLADGDEQLGLPTIICEKGGLSVMLEIANWFRFHEGVIKWILWSTFTLCYDNEDNKLRFLHQDGVKTVIQSLDNFPYCLEINRHGFGILFDLLRERSHVQVGQPRIDLWQIRKLAVNSGIHAVVKSAIEHFSECSDMLMMGQQLLVGTGYTGDIPQFDSLVIKK